MKVNKTLSYTSDTIDILLKSFLGYSTLYFIDKELAQNMTNQISTLITKEIDIYMQSIQNTLAQNIEQSIAATSIMASSYYFGKNQNHLAFFLGSIGSIGYMIMGQEQDLLPITLGQIVLLYLNVKGLNSSIKSLQKNDLREEKKEYKFSKRLTNMTKNAIIKVFEYINDKTMVIKENLKTFFETMKTYPGTLLTILSAFTISQNDFFLKHSETILNNLYEGFSKNSWELMGMSLLITGVSLATNVKSKKDLMFGMSSIAVADAMLFYTGIKENLPFLVIQNALTIGIIAKSIAELYEQEQLHPEDTQYSIIMKNFNKLKKQKQNLLQYIDCLFHNNLDNNKIKEISNKFNINIDLLETKNQENFKSIN